MSGDLKNIVESLLFVSDSPVSLEALKKAIPDADVPALRQVVQELTAEYEARQGGFLLYDVAGGYQFRTRPEYKEWVKRLVQPAPLRLSKAALETLAIIAYHQPVIRSDVEHIRGVDSGAIIRTLLERKLIRILGKKEIPGRPLIYATTKRFLEVFNLKSLNDMPSLKEIQDFSRAAMAGDDPVVEESVPEDTAVTNDSETSAGTSPEETSAAVEEGAPLGPETDPETTAPAVEDNFDKTENGA